MAQLNYLQSVSQHMCSCGAYLWCMSRSNNFPNVSWYQHSENPKSHGTFFLLPYGNKCHVCFLASLIALSAAQFSKYLPLSAESLPYGQVFPGTRSSVRSAADTCGGGAGSRAWQQGWRLSPKQPSQAGTCRLRLWHFWVVFVVQWSRLLGKRKGANLIFWSTAG